MIRHALYVSSRYFRTRVVYYSILSLCRARKTIRRLCVSRLEVVTDDLQRKIVSLRKDLDPYCMLNIQHLIEVLSTSSAMEHKYSADNVRFNYGGGS